MRNLMSIVKILMLLVLSFHVGATMYVESDDGSLLIYDGEKENKIEEVFFKYPSFYTYLRRFDYGHAIIHRGHGSTMHFYTLSNKNLESIDCIYHKNRIKQNGLSIRKAVCGLSLPVNGIYDNDIGFDFLDYVTKDEYSYTYERDAGKYPVNVNVADFDGGVVYRRYLSQDDYQDEIFETIVTFQGEDLTFRGSEIYIVYFCHENACDAESLERVFYSDELGRYQRQELLNFKSKSIK
ncbi:hypothetical protein [Thaumasiovibrio sp. DFM-14]|uniref:hypothetical protein n=1 Tax=Thaumasiovibrio sp. DFM-14 TaxID=3384792 RepID=UPI0039A3AADD